MKKILNNFFWFILGGIVLGSIGVIAYTYQADEIDYTTNKNNQVHNVEQAINDLYSKMDCNYRANDVVFNETYSSSQPYTWTVPCSGRYRIELWGASGGSNRSLDPPGLGSYVSGIIDIEKDDVFYIHIGNQGATVTGGAASPSYNGGGTTGYYSGLYEGFGGGATDIRTDSGSWNNAASLRSRIMVAAGAGGGGGSYSSYYLKGGHAGGLIGISGTCGGTNCNYTPVTGGNQTSGGYNSANDLSGSFGIASQTTTSNGYSGGGGGGWYAGVKGYGTGGSGGSSYISGHTGCVAVTSQSSSSPKSGCTTSTTNNECSISPYGYIFTETNMIDGSGHVWTNIDTGSNSNNLMPNPTGGSYALNTGHLGNGYAKITYLGR